MLRLSVLLPLLHAACAAVRPLPETVRIAITASAAVSRNDHVLDVASPGLVLGQACAGDDPCWVVQKKPAEPELCGDDGRSLASRNSLLLLSHYGGSVSYANYPNLMSVSVLAAMHMVDPSSFFFACPAAGGKLQAQTETLVFASTGGVLELAGNVGGGHHSYGCNVKELVLVLRRSGLQLALGGVPQLQAMSGGLAGFVAEQARKTERLGPALEQWLRCVQLRTARQRAGHNDFVVRPQFTRGTSGKFPVGAWTCTETAGLFGLLSAPSIYDATFSLPPMLSSMEDVEDFEDILAPDPAGGAVPTNTATEGDGADGDGNGADGGDDHTEDRAEGQTAVEAANSGLEALQQPQQPQQPQP